MAEEWRPVPFEGFAAYYEVSSEGRVRSLERTIQYKDGRKRTWPSTIIASSVSTGGYPGVTLYAAGKSMRRSLHTLVAAAFLGPVPEGMEVRHRDGDASNPALENLRYATHSENMLDRLDHGTDPARNRTHCPQGHPLQLPNLMSSALSQGYRKCWACNRAHSWRRYHPEEPLQEASDRYYRQIMADSRSDAS